nr:MAG TPA: hypothetical protein [Caudoviricetes sp.]
MYISYTYLFSIYIFNRTKFLCELFSNLFSNILFF